MKVNVENIMTRACDEGYTVYRSQGRWMLEHSSLDLPIVRHQEFKKFLWLVDEYLKGGRR